MAIQRIGGEAIVAQWHCAFGAANRGPVQGQQPVRHLLYFEGRHRVQGGALQAGNVFVVEHRGLGNGAAIETGMWANHCASLNSVPMLNNMLVLGIESSCDETGVALVQTHATGVPTLLAHALHSQIEMHQDFGGVVPELASRDHIRRVLPLTTEVLQTSGAV